MGLLAKFIVIALEQAASRGFARKTERYHGTCILLAVYAYVTAMITNNSMDDHHTNAMAFFFCGEIRFKYLGKVFLGNAHPFIHYLSEYVIAVNTSNNSNFRIFGDCVDGIADNIEKGLL